MSGAGFAGALTDGGDEYRAADAAGYTRRPADWCHNGHPFRPGTTIDNDPPSDDWCDVCGEARRPASGGVPVEALRALCDDPYDVLDVETVSDSGGAYMVEQVAVVAVAELRSLLDSATTDGGCCGHDAEAHNLAHEVDRVRGRLWRLAAIAGWRPGNPADNDATAELYITEALKATATTDGGESDE